MFQKGASKKECYDCVLRSTAVIVLVVIIPKFICSYDFCFNISKTKVTDFKVAFTTCKS